MSVITRGGMMFPESEELVKIFNRETKKTLGEYILEGGIKGKIFVDPKYTAPVNTIYEVERIELMGKGGPKPTVSVVGRVHETGEVYMMNLVNCWYHEEYQESAQTSLKVHR